jgi:hypothetical protein
MSLYPAPTTGLGVAAAIKVQGNETPLSTTPGYNNVTLSLSATGFPQSFQLDPVLEDAGGNVITPGTAFVVASVASSAAQFTETLSAAAAASAGSTVYTTSSAPAAGSLVGQSFVVAGFTNATNNGTFECTANTTTLITLSNAAGVAETHAGTATSTPTVATYTGTFTGATNGSLVGKTVQIAGFVTNTVNNGSFLIVANTGTTTITVDNSAAVSETHAATATVEENGNALTYFADGTQSYVGGTSPIPVGATGVKVVNLSSTGLISVNGVTGSSVVEVSYPFANNAIPAIVSSGNPMNGLPVNKVYAEVNVTVVE